MHLGKFHFVIWELRNYYYQNKLVASLDDLVAKVAQYSSAPNVDNASVFRVSLDSLYERARNLPADHHTKVFQDVIGEIAGAQYFGTAFEKGIKKIITGSLTPTEQHAKLSEFATGFQNHVQSIISLAEGLDHLGVEYELLAPAHFEFAALLPKELVGESVSDLYNELQHIDRLFRALNELMGKGAISPHVKTISSSWWQFFLDLDSTQIAATTFALERIVALYRQNLEIRKLKRELEQKDLGDDFLEMIDKKIEEKLKAGMQDIAREIREKYGANNDEARNNELETQLRMELVHIAKRINQGASYEVRAGLPEEPESLKEAEKEDPVRVAEYQQSIERYQQLVEHAKQINAAQSEMSDSLKKVSGDNALLTNYEKLAEEKVDEAKGGA